MCYFKKEKFGLVEVNIDIRKYCVLHGSVANM